jgi:hypothetical protein
VLFNLTGLPLAATTQGASVFNLLSVLKSYRAIAQTSDDRHRASVVVTVPVDRQRRPAHDRQASTYEHDYLVNLNV